MTATTRRAALTALASVPALALPSTAMAIAPGPSALDAELFQLIAAAREAEARFDASNDATEVARDRMGEVPVPQALIVTEGDTRHWAEVRPGDYFTRAQLSQIKHSWEQKQKRQLSRLWSDAIADSLHMASLSDKDRALIEMMAAQEVRQDQLVPAFDEWNEMRRLAEERSGVTAAEKLNSQLYDEWYEARRRVANARARTLEGMLAKLAFIAADFEVDESLEDPNRGTSDMILYSVAIDYKTLVAV
jgi:hypothetical protein